MNVCGNLIEQVYRHHFSNNTLHLGHILLILSILQSFVIILFVMFIGDQLSSMLTIAIILGHHKLHLYKLASLINKCMCSDCSINQLFPISLPNLSDFPIPWDTILKLGQLILLQRLLRVQVKGRVTGLWLWVKS